MKKQWKRLAALSSAAVMAVGTLLYFPSGTLQNIRWEIAASAEECYYVNGFCDDDGCTTPYQPAEDSDGDGTYEIANSGQM